MPWKPADAKTHMKGLTPKQQRQWADIANSARQKCIDDGGKPDTCDVSAIKQANGVLAKAMGESMHITSEDAPLTELGRTINTNNETLLRQAAQLLVKVINSIKNNTKAAEDDTTDTTTTKTTDKTASAKEAGTFNQSDTFSLLQSALTQTNGGNGYDTYIADVYEDQGYFVYRKGYSGGYFRCDFEVSSNGAVTLGNPESVVRKVTYINPTTPATESGNPTIAAFTPALQEAGELLETVLLEDSTPVVLTEKAVAGDGTVMLKLIAPGKGSSGYYLPEVLKRDGPRVFTRGMHNFIDHPTAQEEADRPEGSINRLGSTLVEDAHWLDAYRDASGVDAGPGLYARAKVQPGFAGTLDAIAENIGTSIRAMGKSRMGTIGDYRGPIIEAITSAKSVDYVTMPGAGGKVLSLVESARQLRTSTQGANPMNEEEARALRESVQALTAGLTAMREAQARQGAVTLVETALAQYNNLPAPIRAKLVTTLPAQAPLLEDRSAVDVTAFTPIIEAAVQAELNYVQSIGAAMGLGRITGFGSADALTETTDTTNYGAELEKLFAGPSFGLTEAGAKFAAIGRDD